MFGTDDNGASADLLVVKHCELLQRTRGEHSRRTITGHQSRRAWAFAYTGREHDGLCAYCGGSAAAVGDHASVGERMHAAANLDLDASLFRAAS